MALAAGTIWESRTAGSNTACSGGFNPENANMATDGAATSATGNSPVFTSASYNFVAGDVGAWLFIKSGTNWIPGWYQIASVASNAATLTASVGTGVLYAGAIASTNHANSLTPSTSAGCATTGSPTGATWTVDYSQQNAAQFAYTDLASATTTTITSAGFPFGKNQVGNLIKITSGTSWTVQTVEIVSVSGTTATVDKTVGGAGLTGGNGYQGGAYAGPQLPAALIVSGMRYFIKNGAYTINSASNNVASGLIRFTTWAYLEGYDSVRGDLGTAPVFTVSTITGADIITTSPGFVRNVTVDAATQSAIRCFVSGTLYKCIAKNASVGAGVGFVSGGYYFCTADTCATGFNSIKAIFSVAKSCTTGFLAFSLLSKCIATSCTTGFNNSSTTGFADTCVAYNGTTGFLGSSNSAVFYRCLAHTNTTGYSVTSIGSFGWQNVTYNNGTALSVAGSVPSAFYSMISCSADPCTSVAGGDFSINNTAGGGALLRGLVQAFPVIISTSAYLDAGAVQHQDSGGGGGGSGGSFTFS
jgi:hypothetical protein